MPPGNPGQEYHRSVMDRGDCPRSRAARDSSRKAFALSFCAFERPVFFSLAMKRLDWRAMFGAIPAVHPPPHPFRSHPLLRFVKGCVVHDQSNAKEQYRSPPPSRLLTYTQHEAGARVCQSGRHTMPGIPLRPRLLLYTRKHVRADEPVWIRRVLLPAGISLPHSGRRRALHLRRTSDRRGSWRLVVIDGANGEQGGVHYRHGEAILLGVIVFFHLSCDAKPFLRNTVNNKAGTPSEASLPTSREA